MRKLLYLLRKLLYFNATHYLIAAYHHKAPLKHGLLTPTHYLVRPAGLFGSVLPGNVGALGVHYAGGFGHGAVVVVQGVVQRYALPGKLYAGAHVVLLLQHGLV